MVFASIHEFRLLLFEIFELTILLFVAAIILLMLKKENRGYAVFGGIGLLFQLYNIYAWWNYM